MKNHLLRQTNAKAGIFSDSDSGDPGRPTLKRRQPDDAGDPDPGAADGSSSSSDRPTLRRRDPQEPAPTPSPSPEQQ